MQFSAIIIAALAAVASAGPAFKRQAECPQVNDIPACGYPCIVSAATNIGCATDDYPCMCGRFNDLQNAAAGCAINNCGLSGALQVLAAAQAVCDNCV
ncbi:hypothetical protein VTK56DRAFT_5435 [Thermocarpiscus australiensis]